MLYGQSELSCFRTWLAYGPYPHKHLTAYIYQGFDAANKRHVFFKKRRGKAFEWMARNRVDYTVMELTTLFHSRHFFPAVYDATEIQRASGGYPYAPYI